MILTNNPELAEFISRMLEDFCDECYINENLFRFSGGGVYRVVKRLLGDCIKYKISDQDGFFIFVWDGSEPRSLSQNGDTFSRFFGSIANERLIGVDNTSRVAAREWVYEPRRA